MFVFLLIFIFIFQLHATNDTYYLGVINHHIQWFIHCPLNSTRILHPPINNQPLISYECPYGSLPLNIIPIEIDLTFICRSESRLIWFIVDIYQYNDWLGSENIEELNIKIQLNNDIIIKDRKSEIKKFENRSIKINAFYIPFESLKILFNKQIKIFIEINQCQFNIEDNSTWNNLIVNNCQTIQSKSFIIKSAYCQFTPKLIPIETSTFKQLTTTMDIPDFHVVLSIDEQQTTTMKMTLDYYNLFNEHYKNIISTLNILIRTSNLLTYLFIFTIIIFILLFIFFLYTLCYHYHIRSKHKKTSSLII